jgi:branched-chain amino acid aminotransferase
MNECYGKKFIINGELQPSEMFHNSLIYEGDSIYEVIRMVRGNPVFFHDHMERLQTSLKLQRKNVLADVEALRKDIINLTKSNKEKQANLKIVFNYNKDSSDYLVYFIKPIYPSDEQYRTGVKGILFLAERKTPESKVIDHRLRSSIYHKLILEGGYEALLVNEKNLITEGSRSNIFFIKDELLYTAPDNVILNGITRKYIMEICRENDIRIKLECVKADEISEFEAVFMSGTSPIVLPFNCIGNINFNTKLPVFAKLRQLFFRKAEESIIRFRSE